MRYSSFSIFFAAFVTIPGQAIFIVLWPALDARNEGKFDILSSKERAQASIS